MKACMTIYTAYYFYSYGLSHVLSYWPLALLAVSLVALATMLFSITRFNIQTGRLRLSLYASPVNRFIRVTTSKPPLKL